MGDLLHCEVQMRSAASRGYGGWWRRLRREFLQENPWCANCAKQGRQTPATVVDHIKPHRGDTVLLRDVDNLQPLCAICHASVKQSMEKGWLPGCDVDGRPLEPGHPWNGGLPTKRKVPVIIVCGPPASGKSTYVAEKAGPNDLVIDLDQIIRRLSRGRERTQVARFYLSDALKKRDAMLRSLQHDPSCDRAWFIVCAPTRRERDDWAAKLNATVVVLDTDPQTCIERIKQDESRCEIMKDQILAVKRWWRLYRQGIRTT